MAVNRVTATSEPAKDWNFQEALPRLRRCVIALTAGEIEPLRAEMIARAAIKNVLARKLPVSTTTYLRIALYQAVIAECRRFHANKQTDLTQNDGISTKAPYIRSSLLAGFSNLSQDERDVIVLIVVEEFSQADAAQVLDLPGFALAARLTRAREHLQAEIVRHNREGLSYRQNTAMASKMAFLRLVK